MRIPAEVPLGWPSLETSRGTIAVGAPGALPVPPVTEGAIALLANSQPASAAAATRSEKMCNLFILGRPTAFLH